MFLLFINDLPDYVKSCNVRLFADDCVLYRRIHRASDMQCFRTIWIIYFSGNKTGKWSSIPTSVSFYVSPTKRKPFARDYDIHGRKLEEVELAKYLGVTIQKNLSWNIHIDQITKKANSTRAFIQRNLNHFPREMKSTCYLTLVRPLLGYACMVWDPHTAQNTHKLEAVQRRSNTHKLEAVQRRSASFVMNNYQQTSSVTSMLQTLQWPTLAERRARIKATMMYRIVNGLVATPPTELHASTTTARGHTARFIVLYARTQLYRHSFFPDTIRIWNGLPQPLVESTSLETFKQGVLSCDIP